MITENVSLLEKKLGYTFRDKALLHTALTHKTFAFEAALPLPYNERLEFLGDSVLDLIVAEELYQANQFFSEGELTRRRAQLVNNKVLAKKARDLGLGEFLRLGKGEMNQNGALNQTNLANALEALIGAVYLDSSLSSVKSFVFTLLFSKNE